MNNLEIISPLLDFSDPDKFYFIQIYKRRKDNPEMDKDMVVLENYSISGSEQMDRTLPRIQKICDDNNARAYIRLNRRSHKKVALNMMVRLAKMIESEQYNVKNVYWSISGEFSSEEDKTWLLDVDWIDYENEEGKRKLDVIENVIVDLQKEAGRTPMLNKIPSKNGYHIICRPFNISKLKILINDLGSRVDHHKDNPCILYCP
jgi:hypothetical protein